VPNITEAPRVTIAFPFSNIKMNEPTENVRELAAIVAELAVHVAKSAPSAETDALVERAQTLQAKLQH
jgi:outer membrane murein-binding lipoprotein Lpp